MGVGAAAKVVNSAGKRVKAKRINSKAAVVERGSKVNNITKAEKSVGGAKAKRDAAIAKKRGLSATGKATIADVKAAVKKQTAKGKAAKAVVKAVANKVPLKISFKPAELGKTTEKTVQLQIKAVLNKSKGSIGTKKPVVTPAAKNSIVNKSKALPKPRSKVILR